MRSPLSDRRAEIGALAPVGAARQGDCRWTEAAPLLLASRVTVKVIGGGAGIALEHRRVVDREGAGMID